MYIDNTPPVEYIKNPVLHTPGQYTIRAAGIKAGKEFILTQADLRNIKMGVFLSSSVTQYTIRLHLDEEDVVSSRDDVVSSREMRYLLVSD